MTQKVQEDDVKQLLKSAVQQQHNGNEVADQFIRSIGCALIDLGLTSTMSNSFELKPIDCAKIGQQTSALKQHHGFGNKTFTVLISMLSLQKYFTWIDMHKTKYIAACWPEVLPGASRRVRKLLPNIPWKDAPTRQKAPKPKRVSETAPSDTQSSTSSSSKIEAQHALPVQQTQQLPIQQSMSSGPPLAAIVVDLGVRQPGKQSCRLYIVKLKIWKLLSPVLPVCIRIRNPRCFIMTAFTCSHSQNRLWLVLHFTP